MRILLDECLPARLRRDLAGHDVQTVPRAGWILNGSSMDLAPSDEVWNRAAMDKGGPFAKRGDRALAALLRAHGAIMNGGLGHAFDLLDKSDLDLAKDGYIYFGLPQIARLLTSAEKMDEEMREKFGESYSEVIPSDSAGGSIREAALGLTG